MSIYQRERVIAYAKKWYTTNNPAYAWFGEDDDGKTSPYGGEGDCANFVSQCIRAGGLAFKQTGEAHTQWFYYTEGRSLQHKSDSWAGTTSLNIYLREAQRGPSLDTIRVPWAQRYARLEPGDIIFRLMNEAASEEQKAYMPMRHAAIFERFDGEGNMVVYQHTYYRHWVWKDEGKNGLKTLIYHVDSIRD